MANGEWGVVSRVSSLRACDAIRLVVGEGWLAWERRVWHQLDRFTFVRDDGEGVVIAMTGVVIASGSDAIQLVVQEEAGLPRRFAPRNDGWRLGAFRQSLAGSLRVRCSKRFTGSFCRLRRTRLTSR